MGESVFFSSEFREFGSTPDRVRSLRRTRMAGQLEMDPTELNMKFHHVQIFADTIRPHEHYRRLEDLLNGLAHEVPARTCRRERLGVFSMAASCIRVASTHSRVGCDFSSPTRCRSDGYPSLPSPRLPASSGGRTLDCCYLATALCMRVWRKAAKYGSSWGAAATLRISRRLGRTSLSRCARVVWEATDGFGALKCIES